MQSTPLRRQGRSIKSKGIGVPARRQASESPRTYLSDVTGVSESSQRRCGSKDAAFSEISDHLGCLTATIKTRKSAFIVIVALFPPFIRVNFIQLSTLFT